MTFMINFDSKYLALLKNRIDLAHIPFSERGSRLLIMRREDTLRIRLAERWFKADPRLSAYRNRPPIVEQLCFTDGDGTPLAFQTESYPHCVNFITSVGEFSMTFVDPETLYLSLPSEACGISFTAHVDNGQTDRRGGILHVEGNIRRNIAYTTNRSIKENLIEQNTDGNLDVRLRLHPGQATGLLLNLTPRLGFNRYIPPLEETFKASARRWHEWFASVPKVAEAYEYQYYYAWFVMRAGLISTRFYTTREAMTPSKIHYVGVWQWDAYFHALAYRHVDPHLAYDQIRVVLDHQRPDGMIPDAVHDEGTITHLNFPVDADVTKPPLLAWAAWKLYQTLGDREFLDEIYEPIVRWNQWWFEHNDLDGNGLCEYLHPYSSGLDDSPLWDGGMPVTSPDLNTYLYLQMEYLSKIAAVLQLEEDARMWQEKANTLLNRMQELLWDPQAGLFWARRNNEPVRILTPFSLIPLLTGKLKPEISKRLVNHILDTNTFWTRCPLPTVAISEPEYNPIQMWRGPTWVNINYLMVEGLERSGYPQVAVELRRRTLDMLASHGDIHEYYHPETGEPCKLAASLFGWTAAMIIELSIQATRSSNEAYP
jgi:putative isomerase